MNSPSDRNENHHLKRMALSRLAHTYKQAADLLGVSERTVYAWVKDEKLKAFRIGRTVRISTAALEDFIERFEHESNHANNSTN